MPAIFGMLAFDQRPVERKALERMASAMAHRGREVSIHVDGSTGVGYASGRGSRLDGEPAVLDGTVHNLEALGAELREQGLALPESSLCSILIGLERRLGPRFPAALDGFFGLAIV